jgi:exosome complex RNA-binding protein Rrp42 (RNase PH superfamily)
MALITLTILKTDSRCIDLESLCILVEEQAWEVRVDIHVLVSIFIM